MLELEYLGGNNVPLEVESILPERIAGMRPDEIARMEIFHGNRREPLGEFFRVRGEGADKAIYWQGNLESVHWIGAHMTHGRIVVEGNAGRHVGSEMRGGEIQVHGHAGDWVGGEMRGGTIQVQGDAGHLVGSAYRGSPVGMRGGTIMIHGRAGNELGHSMRRGLLAVGGEAGDLIGFGMRAGTILVGGNAGIRHGAGMIRGTLAFFGAEPPPLLPSYRFGCRFRPPALELVLRYLRQFEFPVPDAWFDTMIDLYHGDLLEGGRGEVWISSPA